MKRILKQPVRGRVEKWITALRSGQYKQGRSRLRTEDDCYCCLGVACDISTVDTWSHNHRDRWQYRKQCTNLSTDMRQHYGLFDDIHLIAMNDTHGKTFEEIAGYLESSIRCMETGIFFPDLYDPDWAGMKPSEVLEVAIGDLLEVEKMEGYQVNMSNWHLALSPDLCQVCLAGCVLVREYQVPKSENIFYEHLQQHPDLRIFEFLDAVRRGYFHEALLYFYPEVEGRPNIDMFADYECEVTYYRTFGPLRDEFLKMLADFILKLKEFNL